MVLTSGCLEERAAFGYMGAFLWWQTGERVIRCHASAELLFTHTHRYVLSQVLMNERTKQSVITASGLRLPRGRRSFFLCRRVLVRLPWERRVRISHVPLEREKKTHTRHRRIPPHPQPLPSRHVPAVPSPAGTPAAWAFLAGAFTFLSRSRRAAGFPAKVKARHCPAA